MKCARCGRPLTLPAVAISTRAGPLAFGPKCARFAGLVQQKQRAPTIRRVQIAPDERQADWVMGVM